MVMVSSLTGEVFEAIDVVVSDSDSWEVVDPSDSEDENFSYGDVTSDDDEVVSDIDDLLQHPYGSPSRDISLQSLADEITHHCEEPKDAYEIDHRRQVLADDAVVKDDGLIDGAHDPYKEDVDQSEEEEEYDNDDDDSDLDDELVPKWLNNKFERQRMRKLGKRAYPKMKKSKRVAYQYNRPGCVHGKHGLGLKHNLIW
ncbi:hypothetical protein L2E82_25387 [Cichorium intybus]|uniref:Uncharacterized protein n=1 Tax=Cichorium intybus TaxID=13427 RepID=A0ACB9E3P3_CICIN|nr:hypothetical protein L2E82_25387 [Cichorium intybus]